MRVYLLCGVALLACGTPVSADEGASGIEAEANEAAEARVETDDRVDPDEIIITGARSILPATALPLIYDFLGGERLEEASIVYGSVIDAVAATMPAFSPTREKLSGSGESLRGRSPLFAIEATRGTT